jgi:hypothetical protein
MSARGAAIGGAAVTVYSASMLPSEAPLGH